MDSDPRKTPSQPPPLGLPSTSSASSTLSTLPSTVPDVSVQNLRTEPPTTLTGTVSKPGTTSTSEIVHNAPVKPEDLLTTPQALEPQNIYASALLPLAIGQETDFGSTYAIAVGNQIPVPTFSSTVTIGYASPPTLFNLPSLWAVKLLENISPVVQCVSHDFMSSNPFSRKTEPAANINEEVMSGILEPALNAFKPGTALALYSLNADLFLAHGLSFMGGCLISSPYTAPSVISPSPGNLQIDTLRILSGAVEGAIVMADEFYALPTIKKANIRSTSGIDSVSALSWLRSPWIPSHIPNPIMVKGFSDLEYVNATLDHNNTFRFGKSRTVVSAPSKIPLVSVFATTLDNITVELLNIADQAIKDQKVPRQRLEALVGAHSPWGTVVQHFSTMEDLHRPFTLPPSDTMLAQLFLAIAKVPSLTPVIHKLYADYIANSGLLRVATAPDFLKTVEGNSLGGSSSTEYYNRIGGVDLTTLLEALTFEIAPTLTYPTIVIERPYDPASLVMVLMETLLFFVVFPKAAKFVAYELCNRIRHILKLIFPTQWATYVAQNGYVNGAPGTANEITRDQYLTNLSRPTLLLGAQRNGAWQVTASIAQFIAPVGRYVARTRATQAGLPTIDPAIFVPWDDPGYDWNLQAITTDRFIQITTFVNETIMPAIKNKYKGGSLQVSALTALVNMSDARAISVGSGLGRGLHRMFSSMVDFATNVVHSYDGRLDTPLPRPIAVFDDLPTQTSLMNVQQIDANYFLPTQNVWALFYNVEFIFNTTQIQTSLAAGDVPRINVEDPIKVTSDHLSVFSFSEQVVLPLGLAARMLNPRLVNVEPYTFANTLLRVAKVSGEYMSRGTFSRIMSAIRRCLKFPSDTHFQTVGLPDITLAGDDRIIQPIYRRLSSTNTRSPPDPADPPILQGIPEILAPGRVQMFEYGLDLLLNPTSALCQIGVGFVLSRVRSQDVSFNDINQVDLTNAIDLRPDMFQVVLQGTSNVPVLILDGQRYVSCEDLPAPVVFRVDNPGYISPAQWTFIVSGIQSSKVSLVFPNSRYLYTLHFLDRAAYNRQVLSQDLVSMIAAVNTSTVVVQLCSTRQVFATSGQTAPGECIRYFFPLNAPKTSLAFQDLISYELPPTFAGPRPRIYDTGRNDGYGRNCYSSGVQKRKNGLSIANELKFYEVDDSFYQPPTIHFVLPTQLEMRP